MITRHIIIWLVFNHTPLRNFKVISIGSKIRFEQFKKKQFYIKCHRENQTQHIGKNEVKIFINYVLVTTNIRCVILLDTHL